VQGAYAVWDDNQTHMRGRNRWKKLKNYESNVFSS